MPPTHPMSRLDSPGIGDLFAGDAPRGNATESLAEGATLLRGFVGEDAQALLRALQPIVATAPFRHMVTPGGHRMSVAMTNCGTVGWITDRSGYRYDALDPEAHRRCPAMPP